jgi:hypothetical protein
MSLTNDQLVEELSKKTVLEIAELVKLVRRLSGAFLQLLRYVQLLVALGGCC